MIHPVEIKLNNIIYDIEQYDFYVNKNQADYNT